MPIDSCRSLVIWWGVLDSKFSPWLPIKDHYDTLVDQRDGHWYFPDYLILIGAPVASGAGVGYWYQLGDMASFIGGTAVLHRVLFAMVVHVFQLRMQLLDNPHVPREGNLAGFIDQLFANVNYAVVVGIGATAVSMAAAVTATDGHIGHIWSGVVAALGVHLMLVVIMCIKRIRAAYREIKQSPGSRTSRFTRSNDRGLPSFVEQQID